jgi:hypothetical protein
MMNDVAYLPLQSPSMKSYICRAVVTPRDGERYAHGPALSAYGATTWGATQEAALRQLHTTVERIVADLIPRGDALPDSVIVFSEPLVSIVTR